MYIFCTQKILWVGGGGGVGEKERVKKNVGLTGACTQCSTIMQVGATASQPGEPTGWGTNLTYGLHEKCIENREQMGLSQRHKSIPSF